MIGHIARNEWRNLVAERAIAPLALLLTVLIAYGLYNGVEWNQFREATLAGTKAEQQKRLRKLERTLTEIEAGTRKPTGFQDPRSGGAIGGTTGVPYVTMPPGALAPLAVGQSDLYPYYFKISLRSKQTTLNNDEIENPVNLLAGRFDLAFVIVYLYPLLILALSYNILSGEKEQGTLALTLANPVSLTKLLAGKMLARAGLLLGLAVGITAVAVWVAGVDSGREGALARLGLWMLVIVTYGLFWFTLAVAVNAWGKSSATNALVLAGAWLGWAILVPSLLHLTSSSLYPVPSRVEMIQAMRSAGKEAQKKGSQTLARFYEDHPELAPAGEAKAPDFASLTYASQIEIDRMVAPILKNFDAQVASQQAVVDRFSYLSPAVLAQQALNDLAGTGLGAYQHFQAQADRFLKTWQEYFFPKIFARERISAAGLRQLPEYRYEEEPLGPVMARVMLALLGILAPTGIAAAVAWVKLRSYQVAG